MTKRGYDGREEEAISKKPKVNKIRANEFIYTSTTRRSNVKPKNQKPKCKQIKCQRTYIYFNNQRKPYKAKKTRLLQISTNDACEKEASARIIFVYYSSLLSNMCFLNATCLACFKQMIEVIEKYVLHLKLPSCHELKFYY